MFVHRLAEHWGEINHRHAFREGNTRTQPAAFAQLAHQAGWELDVARLSPRHEHSMYTQFVDARFEHQRLRDVPGSSVQDAALDLASTLSSLITPEVGPEAALRRVEVTGEVTAAQQISQRQARYPELRDAHLSAGGTSSLGSPGTANASADYDFGG